MDQVGKSVVTFSIRGYSLLNFGGLQMSELGHYAGVSIYMLNSKWLRFAIWSGLALFHFQKNWLLMIDNHGYHRKTSFLNLISELYLT